MRHAAARALLERDDVIIVASVGCIYGIGSVETYGAMTQDLERGMNTISVRSWPIWWPSNIAAMIKRFSVDHFACAAMC